MLYLCNKNTRRYDIVMEKILRTAKKFIPTKLFKMAQPAYHYLLAMTGVNFSFKQQLLMPALRLPGIVVWAGCRLGILQQNLQGLMMDRAILLTILLLIDPVITTMVFSVIHL